MKREICATARWTGLRPFATSALSYLYDLIEERMTTLHENEYHLLQALVDADDGDAAILVAELAARLSLDQSLIMAAGATLMEAGLAEMIEKTYEELRLGDVGRGLAQTSLPERAIIVGLEKAGGSATIKELPALTGLEQKIVGQSLRFLTGKGWAQKSGPALDLTDAGRAALHTQSPDEQLVAHLDQVDSATMEDLVQAGVDGPGGLKLLKGRKGVVKVKERTLRSLRASAAGRKEAKDAVVRPEVNQLTSAMLADGTWRDVDFRPYDMGAETEPVHPGKEHPFRRVLEQTRRVFLEMGFSEIVSPFVESSFWDFDALFQPQDHPARDMQDTFYMGRPNHCELPDDEVLQAVRRTHEDGGDTGSVGWRYKWSQDLAAKPVLRTHTTACTIRALAEDPNPPRKVFSVGKVFRRETVDYKHLPVFYQVDGIIIDEKASFASLLGTLEAFYRKMGFDKFQFRPAFFPYTEPSVEIFVYMEEKKDWVEMGGAGVFRPEVTEPFGCKVPVLAWGLGLERLAMFRYGLKDIRQIYISDLAWLKEAKLCR
jgi:phenylalanyl-tRNA synthetase alpha chain